MPDFQAMSDVELVLWVRGHAGAEGAGGSAELTRRSIEMTKRNTEAIDELRSVTEKSGDQVVVLTRALVVFTVVLVALTLALLVDAVAG
ncbi:MAG TPA: hypothetical protein VM142_11040 [Acidimicrobiales bacterium]|nr:hypothetical protein [Acidimicrobiales bacterium]